MVLETNDSGVDIRGDDRSGLMHHKVMIVDGYVVITGSHNWSDSAEDSNDENIIVLNSTGIAY
ncbi:MAG: phospholipase D-like domain-containing protein, partial [Candidatus Thorarchaeota archaeon]